MKRSKAIHEIEEFTPEDPALTPEARQNQMIALSESLAEKQLREGTASAMVITHYLKLATERERLEVLKMQKEIAMIEAKTKALDSAKEIETLYKDALEAVRSYSGFGSGNDY